MAKTTEKTPAPKKEKVLKVKVDKTLLKDNPELADQGIEVGETIEVPKAAIINSDELEKNDQPEKPVKVKGVDPVVLAQFIKLAVGSSQSESSLKVLAVNHFGPKAVMHRTPNNREVFFMVNGVKVPENGYLHINIF